MKNSRKCPKCGSTDIVCCKAVVKGAYDRIQRGIVAQADTDRWVCCACGYCELWVDQEALKDLREYWGVPEDNGTER
ncbi:hypothetical protein [uncultured Dysosmobacter sp.]|uniref:hypothetical protein n=1 Tax=uncultured Dysosmobacter sp. TaxID=2591384 RepID=UPI002613C04D|nr:hypothetical protein [uncultured Dysosmobacter sp.]